MNKIKIAHITTIDWSLRYLLLNQLRSLQQAGHVVFGISSSGPEVLAIEAAGIHHISVPMTRRALTPLADIRALLGLYRVIRRERFTIVHTHTPKAGIYGRWAAKLARVPVIIHTNHGFFVPGGSRWLSRYFFIGMEKVAALCSDVIFFVNEEDIEMGVHEGIFYKKKIKPLGKGGIGIDITEFDPDRIPVGEVEQRRNEITLRCGSRVVGFVGRLVQEKGLLELFAAARIVREKVPEVHFLIIGPVDKGKADVLTPDIAQKYDVADICHFTGMRQDMPELYSLMDVFVLPSHREGFPRAAMEASAMKIPCVVTNIRGCREVVEHGINGLVVPLGDVQALANAIVELLTDREKARQMGEEGRRIAIERFDEQSVFEKVNTEYVRLLYEKGLSVSTDC